MSSIVSADHLFPILMNFEMKQLLLVSIYISAARKRDEERQGKYVRIFYFGAVTLKLLVILLYLVRDTGTWYVNSVRTR